MNYRKLLTRPRRVVAGLAMMGLLCGALMVNTAGSALAADTSTKYFGVFRETTPTQIASGASASFGVTPASVMWFDAWATGNAFSVADAKALWSQGIMPHFTWEPWNTSLGVGDSAQIHLQDIINGTWDTYIKARGAEFASAGSPIMVRFGHEFNGNWYPWGTANNSNNPALYINAYRHVHDLVVAAGATNVQWVWAIANDSVPAESWNDPSLAYPGSAYVDWVGIDGYNWGFGPSWDTTGDHWTSFNTMFSSAYQRIRSIAPNKPVMIAEYGSSEDGGNKAAWINDMNAQLQSGSYPDLKLLTYFDQDKEELWSAASSTASQAAFVSWLKQPYLNGTGSALSQIAAQYAAAN
jgi:beta-mannanase